jgi:predicted CoA-binding protein
MPDLLRDALRGLPLIPVPSGRRLPLVGSGIRYYHSSPFRAAMDPEIDDFVRCRNLAILGVSRSGKGFGNAALKELRARGYTASIVHPEVKEIGGERCFPNLESLKGEVDGVLISVPPPRAVGVIRDAYASDIRKVWMQ